VYTNVVLTWKFAAESFMTSGELIFAPNPPPPPPHTHTHTHAKQEKGMER
jgi:hypothetical protein